ncbi:MAG: hypothetical protein L3J08_06730 [Flavobacteriaceae bacterium]|nr:hypothetical protein [Flavobacteriaceae bacterium]
MKNFLIIIFLFLVVSCDFAPGSFPYATRYEINLPEAELIKKIELFKETNSKYAIPNGYGYEDGRDNESSHWYYFYFNDVVNKQIFLTWVRKKAKTESTFALVSVKPYSGLGNWKRINKDYKGSENEKIIKYFEKMILSKLDINEFVQK